MEARRFTKRLAELCLDGESFPRRRADRLLLLKSAVSRLSPSRVHSEVEVNRVLRAWTDTVGSRLGVDHVSLRRYLVDEGLLVRDPSGATYSIGAGRIPEDVPSLPPGVDMVAALDAVRRARASRKARFDHAMHRQSPTS